MTYSSELTKADAEARQLKAQKKAYDEMRIRQRMAEGLSKSEIAQSVGCSLYLVECVMRGKKKKRTEAGRVWVAQP